MRIGFVPTMGALHEGHLSLVRQARGENDIVVVSIFVNPLQFGRGEDLGSYPRPLRADLGLLEKGSADLVFVPSAGEFYPRDFQSLVSVGRLSRPLCGKRRPTHFAGVCTVVLKLLNLVMPDTLYLGQKDYQQFRVLGQLVKDLDFPVRLRMAPIVREPDGLAMSSRNVFLSAAHRSQAPLIYRALKKVRSMIRSGMRDGRALRRAMRGVLKEAPGARVDYAEIVDAGTLQSVIKLKKGARILAALAVSFEKTRLIDNILIRV